MNVNQILVGNKYYDQDFTDAMWWMQRWISGALNDPTIVDEMDSIDLSLDEAFSFLKKLVGNKHCDALMWRYLNLSDGELDRLQGTRVLLPHGASYLSFPYQSFTSSQEVAEWLAQESEAPADKPHKVIIGCEPPADKIVFSLKGLLRTPETEYWTESLSDWFREEEIVVKVDEPIAVNHLYVYEHKSSFRMT